MMFYLSELKMWMLQRVSEAYLLTRDRSWGLSTVEADQPRVEKYSPPVHLPSESTSIYRPNSRLKYTLYLSKLLYLAKLFIYFLNSQCTTLDPTAAAPLYTAHILQTVLEVVDDIPVFGCGYLSWSGHREGSASGGVVVVVLGGSGVKLEIGVGRRGRGGVQGKRGGGSLRWSSRSRSGGFRG